MGVRKLKHVYDMSFAEFQIRLFAYKRVQQREWEKVRMISWYAMRGPHMDPKSMPKTLDSFMKLDFDNKNVSKVSEAQKERFLEAYKDYIEKTKQWQG